MPAHPKITADSLSAVSSQPRNSCDRDTLASLTLLLVLFLLSAFCLHLIDLPLQTLARLSCVDIKDPHAAGLSPICQGGVSYFPKAGGLSILI